MSEIYYLSAVEQLKAVRSKALSVRELVEAHINRIESVDSKINALVTRTFDQAINQANAADLQIAKGAATGALFGLPIAHKDSFLVRGVRTTFGSRAFENFVPETDSAVVSLEKSSGAISFGKTNMPEFGAGSHTFNEVFGITRNPYRLDVSAGGSSGGSAAALAAGMVPLADGTDMGGSLRNPASFCNVVGLRPSLGRVPIHPANLAFNTVTVAGPMARTVEDVALLFSVMAGHHPLDPLAVSAAPSDFFPLRPKNTKGVKIAYDETIGGLPIDPEVRNAFRKALRHLESIGCVLEEKSPNFDGVDRCFETFRALAFATNFSALLDKHGDRMKTTVRENIKKGMAIGGVDVISGNQVQTRLFQEMAKLLQDFEFFVCPVSQVVPFPVEQEYPKVVDGQAMSLYIEWMRSCSRITVSGHPSISVPFTFTDDGLPVGLQIVGAYRGESSLLDFAAQFETSLSTGKRRPNL